MDQDQQMYKHYERPQGPRHPNRTPDSKSWPVVITILVIIAIALVPVVLNLSAQNDNLAGEKIAQLQHSKKSSTKLKKSRGKSTKTKASAKKAQQTDKASENSEAAAKTEKASQYTVQSGDTLTSIAQKNNMTVDTLAQLNKLDSSAQVYTGQVLKIK